MKYHRNFYFEGVLRTEWWEHNRHVHREGDWAIRGYSTEGTLVCEEWRMHGTPHRVGGPAKIAIQPGRKEETWTVRGRVHRDDGPAMTIVEGDASCHIWCKNDFVHREDGPAKLFFGRARHPDEHYLHGIPLQYDEYRCLMKLEQKARLVQLIRIAKAKLYGPDHIVDMLHELDPDFSKTLKASLALL